MREAGRAGASGAAREAADVLPGRGVIGDYRWETGGGGFGGDLIGC